MFCSSCAARLPSFKPTGPSALQALGSMGAAPVEVQAHDAFRPPGSGALARSATGLAFWQWLVLVVLAMVVVFAAWFVYVTRRADDPTAESTAANAPVERVAPVASATMTASPPLLAPDAAEAPAPEVMPAPSPSASAEGKATPEAAADEIVRPAPLRQKRVVERRPAAARPAAPSGPSEPAPAAVARTLAMARADVDSGPPIAAGPGPLYNPAPRTVARATEDSGPPVAAGPGPLYESSSRGPVRAPAWARNDPGPPIVIGPGPLVDYASERARGR